VPALQTAKAALKTVAGNGGEEDNNGEANGDGGGAASPPPVHAGLDTQEPSERLSDTEARAVGSSVRLSLLACSCSTRPARG
jgi:hypothetical protein